jgi:hypothetical protein
MSFHSHSEVGMSCSTSCDAGARLARDRETYICEHNSMLSDFTGITRYAAGDRRTRARSKVIEGETSHDAPFREIRADKAPGVSSFPSRLRTEARCYLRACVSRTCADHEFVASRLSRGRAQSAQCVPVSSVPSGVAVKVACRRETQRPVGSVSRSRVHHSRGRSA